jgi:hypothetical protein
MGRSVSSTLQVSKNHELAFAIVSIDAGEPSMVKSLSTHGGNSKRSVLGQEKAKVEGKR